MTQPNVENMRKRAKGLLEQLREGDAAAAERVLRGLPRLSGATVEDVRQAAVTLQEVQHVIAVEQGFGNWKELLSGAGAGARPRPRITLYIRPGLPSVRRQVDWFLWMIGRGEGWTMERLRRDLPRAASLSDAEIARTGVTDEEARQVVASGYGYPDWATLEEELGKLPPIATFADFADLEDHQVQQLIHRLGRDRLAVALKTASEQMLERFRTNMAPRSWRALVDAIEALGSIPQSTVEVERARVVANYGSAFAMT